MTRIDCTLATRDCGARVATVTIDNQRRLNVLDRAAAEDLRAAIVEAGGDEAVRAIVLKGAGERAWIGGADIGEMVGLTKDEATPFITVLHQAIAAIREAPVPVIAPIRGYCLGAGLEVAAGCDLRIAAEDARFGMPEVRVGVPSVIEAALLPRLIGWGRTGRLLYTGGMIPAQTAYDWGLVEEVVPADRLDAAVEALLDAIIQAGPRAVRLQKQLMRRWEDLPLKEAVAAGILAFEKAFETDEPRTMMRAFLDRKR